MLALFLVFKGTSALFSIVAVPIYIPANIVGGYTDGASGKDSTCQCRRHKTRVQSLGWEGSLEEVMATHSSILA